MLSRVADSLYWMSRYLERAEHTARLVDVDLQLRLDQSAESATERWQRLLASLQIPAPLAGEMDATTLARTLTFSRSSPSSIVSCVATARENLRQVRAVQFFRSVQEGVHLFQGITDSTMSHGEGWHYIQLGRFVERTDMLASLIGTHFSRLLHPPDQAVESTEYLEWVGLLKCCTAFEAYCKVYTADVRPLRVAEFLLLNPEFPHSIRFSVEMVQAALQVIGELTQRKAAQPIRLAGRLKAALSFSQIDEIMANGAPAYLENIRNQCGQAHRAIQQIYFDYPIESAVAS